MSDSGKTLRNVYELAGERQEKRIKSVDTWQARRTTCFDWLAYDFEALKSSNAALKLEVKRLIDIGVTQGGELAVLKAEVEKLEKALEFLWERKKK